MLELDALFNITGALVTSICGATGSCFLKRIELHVFVGTRFDLDETASLTSNNADESNVKAADV